MRPIAAALPSRGSSRPPFLSSFPFLRPTTTTSATLLTVLSRAYRLLVHRLQRLTPSVIVSALITIQVDVSKDSTRSGCRTSGGGG